MQELRDRYERAQQRYDAIANKIARQPEPAPMGFTQENQRKSAFEELVAARNALIAAGGWEGPIPIKLKRKYFGRTK